MVTESYISKTTLNGNGLNAPTKRYTLAEQIKKTISIYILFTIDIPQAKEHVQTKSKVLGKEILYECKSKEDWSSNTHITDFKTKDIIADKK